jgi:hypothetical protein
MSWLAPPTDNLYKFMSVFGIVVAVTGFLMRQRTERSFREAATAMEVEKAKVVNDQLARWDKRMSLIKQDLDLPLLGTEKDYREHKKIMAQLDAPELRQSLEDIQRNESFIKAKNKLDEASAEYIAGTNYLYLVSGGLLLSAAGFYLWFVRLQRFLDKQLAAATNSPQRARHG